MWNLVKNAARYARPQPGAIRIVLDGYADRVEISVIDNGPGVPGSVQAQLRAVLHHRGEGHRARPVPGAELCAANRASLEYVNEAAGAHSHPLPADSK